MGNNLHDELAEKNEAELDQKDWNSIFSGLRCSICVAETSAIKKLS